MSINSVLGIEEGPLNILYHNNSIDGFSAAFLIWREVQRDNTGNDVEFIGTDYGFVPYSIEKKHVVCLGFTYRKSSMLTALDKSKSLTVIDNHPFEDDYLREELDRNLKFTHIYDETKSSAAVVWELLYPEEEINSLISHVQDRELWLFRLKNTREVLAALNSYPMDFSTWLQLFNTPMDIILKEGVIVRRYQTELTKTVIKNSTRIDFLGYQGIPIVNCPWFIMSEVVGILSNAELFAIGYFDTYNKRHFSLRASIRSKVNVLKLARQFGGGGHKNAAGFTANTNDNNLILGKLLSEG